MVSKLCRGKQVLDGSLINSESAGIISGFVNRIGAYKGKRRVRVLIEKPGHDVYTGGNDPYSVVEAGEDIELHVRIAGLLEEIFENKNIMPVMFHPYDIPVVALSLE